MNKLPISAYSVELLEEDNKHFYLVKNKSGDLMHKFPGVTGRLQWIGGEKTQRLMGWAGSQVGLEWLRLSSSARKGNRTLTQGMLDQLYFECRGAAIRNRDKTAELGTEGHLAFENIVNGRKVDLDKITPDLRECVRSFSDFWHNLEYRPIVLATEPAVASIEDEFGGSVDLIAYSPKHDGVVIYDWKTGMSGIHDEMALQLGAYANAIHHMFNVPVVTAFIVRCPRDGGEAEVKEVRNLGLAYKGFQTAMRMERQMAQEMWK